MTTQSDERIKAFLRELKSTTLFYTDVDNVREEWLRSILHKALRARSSPSAFKDYMVSVFFPPKQVGFRGFLLFFTFALWDIRRIHKLARINSGSLKIVKAAPGSRLLSLVEFLYSPVTVERTFKPTVVDWRTEYFEALKQKRVLKARWISVRYIYRFILAMGLSNIFSLIKGFKSISK